MQCRFNEIFITRKEELFKQNGEILSSTIKPNSDLSLEESTSYEKKNGKMKTV